MSVSMQDIRDILDSEEPDYDAGASLGEAALPHLSELVKSADPLLAAKATHLAARIGSQAARHVVALAAERPEPQVRIAAAAGLGDLPEEPEVVLLDAMENRTLLDRLLDDPDPGVRKFARKSARRSR